MMKEILNTIVGFFKGELSSLRLSMVLAVATVFGTWSTISIMGREVKDIPSGVVVILSAIFAAKVWQKSYENS